MTKRSARQTTALLGLVFLGAARRTGKLCIEGFAIAQTAAKELGPFRDDRLRVGSLGEKTPQRRVVPAELVPRAVPVLADSGAQTPRFRDELFA